MAEPKFSDPSTSFLMQLHCQFVVPKVTIRRCLAEGYVAGKTGLRNVLGNGQGNRALAC